jgi:Alpha/beta hydrolase domain
MRTRSTRRGAARLLAALVAGAVLAGAGCSGDDEEDGDAQGADEASSPEGEGAGDRAGRGGDVASPAVEGPITGGAYDLPFNPMPSRLADDYGYVEDEYFISGEATAYSADGAWGEDGDWTATAGATAPYTTRILVRRPTDAEAFNGTVLVEWLNVSSGMDADPGFGLAHDLLLRDGYAYVGVSAQTGGVTGEGALRLDIPGFQAQSLKEWDPDRYAPLEHPGDAWSYDIYSQVAQVVRRPGDVDPLDGLDVERVIAAGESQSAMRMVTYVNAVHPLADIYDGFLVHSRGGGGAPLGDTADDPVPPVARIRTDLGDPVLQFQTETDIFGILTFHPARQPDTDALRTWEVAGTAHADQSTLDYGIESGNEWRPGATIDFTQICGALNDGPQSLVLRAAIASLTDWVAGGDPPPEAPPLEVAGEAVARDERGIALGGIRTPAVDAPVSTLTGDATPGEPVICLLFGGVTPFDATTLLDLYPSHDGYVAAVTAAADEAVEAGFLLREDADLVIADAEESVIPGTPR